MDLAGLDDIGSSSNGRDEQHAWTVHDGKFFAAHLIREHRARAPGERRLASSEQLSAWVDGCGDFVGTGQESSAPVPFRQGIAGLHSGGRAYEEGDTLFGAESGDVTADPPRAARVRRAVACTI